MWLGWQWQRQTYFVVITVYFSVYELHFNNKVHKNSYIHTVLEMVWIKRHSYMLLLGMLSWLNISGIYIDKFINNKRHIYPKVYTHMHTKVCTKIFTAILFVIGKVWENSKCLSTEALGRNKLGYNYTREYHRDV